MDVFSCSSSRARVTVEDEPAVAILEQQAQKELAMGWFSPSSAPPAPARSRSSNGQLNQKYLALPPPSPPFTSSNKTGAENSKRNTFLHRQLPQIANLSSLNRHATGSSERGNRYHRCDQQDSLVYKRKRMQFHPGGCASRQRSREIKTKSLRGATSGFGDSEEGNRRGVQMLVTLELDDKEDSDLYFDRFPMNEEGRIQQQSRFRLRPLRQQRPRVFNEEVGPPALADVTTTTAGSSTNSNDCEETAVSPLSAKSPQQTQRPQILEGLTEEETDHIQRANVATAMPLVAAEEAAPYTGNLSLGAGAGSTGATDTTLKADHADAKEASRTDQGTGKEDKFGKFVKIDERGSGKPCFSNGMIALTTPRLSATGNDSGFEVMTKMKASPRIDKSDAIHSLEVDDIVSEPPLLGMLPVRIAERASKNTNLGTMLTLATKQNSTNDGIEIIPTSPKNLNKKNEEKTSLVVLGVVEEAGKSQADQSSVGEGKDQKTTDIQNGNLAQKSSSTEDGIEITFRADPSRRISGPSKDDGDETEHSDANALTTEGERTRRMCNTAATNSSSLATPRHANRSKSANFMSPTTCQNDQEWNRKTVFINNEVHCEPGVVEQVDPIFIVQGKSFIWESSWSDDPEPASKGSGISSKTAQHQHGNNDNSGNTVLSESAQHISNNECNSNTHASSIAQQEKRSCNNVTAASSSAPSIWTQRKIPVRGKRVAERAAWLEKQFIVAPPAKAATTPQGGSTGDQGSNPTSSPVKERKRFWMEQASKAKTVSRGPVEWRDNAKHEISTTDLSASTFSRPNSQTTTGNKAKASNRSFSTTIAPSLRMNSPFVAAGSMEPNSKRSGNVSFQSRSPAATATSDKLNNNSLEEAKKTDAASSSQCGKKYDEGTAATVTTSPNQYVTRPSRNLSPESSSGYATKASSSATAPAPIGAQNDSSHWQTKETTQATTASSPRTVPRSANPPCTSNSADASATECYSSLSSSFTPLVFSTPSSSSESSLSFTGLTRFTTTATTETTTVTGITPVSCKSNGGSSSITSDSMRITKAKALSSSSSLTAIGKSSMVIGPPVSSDVQRNRQRLKSTFSPQEGGNMPEQYMHNEQDCDDDQDCHQRDKNLFPEDERASDSLPKERQQQRSTSPLCLAMTESQQSPQGQNHIVRQANEQKMPPYLSPSAATEHLMPQTSCALEIKCKSQLERYRRNLSTKSHNDKNKTQPNSTQAPPKTKKKPSVPSTSPALRLKKPKRNNQQSIAVVEADSPAPASPMLPPLIGSPASPSGLQEGLVSSNSLEQQQFSKNPPSLPPAQVSPPTLLPRQPHHKGSVFLATGCDSNNKEGAENPVAATTTTAMVTTDSNWDPEENLFLSDQSESERFDSSVSSIWSSPLPVVLASSKTRSSSPLPSSPISREEKERPEEDPATTRRKNDTTFLRVSDAVREDASGSVDTGPSSSSEERDRASSTISSMEPRRRENTLPCHNSNRIKGEEKESGLRVEQFSDTDDKVEVIGSGPPGDDVSSAGGTETHADKANVQQQLPQHHVAHLVPSPGGVLSHPSDEQQEKRENECQLKAAEKEGASQSSSSLSSQSEDHRLTMTALQREQEADAAELKFTPPRPSLTLPTPPLLPLLATPHRQQQQEQQHESPPACVGFQQRSSTSPLSTFSDLDLLSHLLETSHCTAAAVTLPTTTTTATKNKNMQRTPPPGSPASSMMAVKGMPKLDFNLLPLLPRAAGDSTNIIIKKGTATTTSSFADEEETPRDEINSPSTEKAAAPQRAIQQQTSKSHIITNKCASQVGPDDESTESRKPLLPDTTTVPPSLISADPRNVPGIGDNGAGTKEVGSPVSAAMEGHQSPSLQQPCRRKQHGEQKGNDQETAWDTLLAGMLDSSSFDEWESNHRQQEGDMAQLSLPVREKTGKQTQQEKENTDLMPEFPESSSAAEFVTLSQSSPYAHAVYPVVSGRDVSLPTQERRRDECVQPVSLLPGEPSETCRNHCYAEIVDTSITTKEVHKHWNHKVVCGSDDSSDGGGDNLKSTPKMSPTRRPSTMNVSSSIHGRSATDEKNSMQRQQPNRTRLTLRGTAKSDPVSSPLRSTEECLLTATAWEKKSEKKEDKVDRSDDNSLLEKARGSTNFVSPWMDEWDQSDDYCNQCGMAEDSVLEPQPLSKHSQKVHVLCNVDCKYVEKEYYAQICAPPTPPPSLLGAAKKRRLRLSTSQLPSVTVYPRLEHLASEEELLSFLLSRLDDDDTTTTRQDTISSFERHQEEDCLFDEAAVEEDKTKGKQTLEPGLTTEKLGQRQTINLAEKQNESQKQGADAFELGISEQQVGFFQIVEEKKEEAPSPLSIALTPCRNHGLDQTSWAESEMGRAVSKARVLREGEDRFYAEKSNICHSTIAGPPGERKVDDGTTCRKKAEISTGPKQLVCKRCGREAASPFNAGKDNGFKTGEAYYCSELCRVFDRGPSKTTNNSNPIRVCNHCGMDGTLTGDRMIPCKRCKEVYYCSDFCRAHDKYHPRTCPSSPGPLDQCLQESQSRNEVQHEEVAAHVDNVSLEHSETKEETSSIQLRCNGCGSTFTKIHTVEDKEVRYCAACCKVVVKRRPKPRRSYFCNLAESRETIERTAASSDPPGAAVPNGKLPLDPHECFHCGFDGSMFPDLMVHCEVCKTVHCCSELSTNCALKHRQFCGVAGARQETGTAAQDRKTVFGKEEVEGGPQSMGIKGSMGTVLRSRTRRACTTDLQMDNPSDKGTVAEPAGKDTGDGATDTAKVAFLEGQDPEEPKIMSRMTPVAPQQKREFVTYFTQNGALQPRQEQRNLSSMDADRQFSEETKGTVPRSQTRRVCGTVGQMNRSSSNVDHNPSDKPAGKDTGDELTDRTAVEGEDFKEPNRIVSCRTPVALHHESEEPLQTRYRQRNVSSRDINRQGSEEKKAISFRTHAALHCEAVTCSTQKKVLEPREGQPTVISLASTDTEARDRENISEVEYVPFTKRDHCFASENGLTDEPGEIWVPLLASATESAACRTHGRSKCREGRGFLASPLGERRQFQMDTTNSPIGDGDPYKASCDVWQRKGFFEFRGEMSNESLRNTPPALPKAYSENCILDGAALESMKNPRCGGNRAMHSLVGEARGCSFKASEECMKFGLLKEYWDAQRPGGDHHRLLSIVTRPREVGYSNISCSEMSATDFENGYRSEDNSTQSWTVSGREGSFYKSRNAPVLSWFGSICDSAEDSCGLSVRSGSSQRVEAYREYVKAYKNYVSDRRSVKARSSRRRAYDRLNALRGLGQNSKPAETVFISGSG